MSRTWKDKPARLVPESMERRPTVDEVIECLSTHHSAEYPSEYVCGYDGKYGKACNISKLEVVELLKELKERRKHGQETVSRPG